MDVHNQLRCIEWNARGVRSKLCELYDYLFVNEIDICLINETKLNNNVNLRTDSRFALIRLDRDVNIVTERDNNSINNPGGGVMIILRRGIRFDVLPLCDTATIECVGVEIHALNRSLLVFAAYFSGARTSAILTQFKRDLLKLVSLNRPFIIAGDFNCRHSFWNCSRSNAAGRVMYDLMCSNPFQIHFSQEHTYVPDDPIKSPSTLDLVLTNAIIPVSTPVTVDSLSTSDHLPILFTINEQIPNESDLYHIRDFSNANWSLFKNTVNQGIDLLEWTPESLMSTQSIDTAIHLLMNVIKEAERQSIPTKTVNHNFIQLDDHTKQLIAQRNALRRNQRRNRDNTLRPIINEMTRAIKEHTQRQINHRFSSNLRSMNSNDPLHKKLYRLTRSLKNRNNKVPVLKVGDTRLIRDIDKAEALSQKICDAHQLTHNNISTVTLERQVRRSINQLNTTDVEADAISNLVKPREITSFIRLLKNRKAPGPDGISNRCLKHLPHRAVILLTQIMNACLRLSYFPMSMKTASIVTFRKPNKDPSNPANYRPISLLSNIAKLFERVILSRLSQVIEDKNLINNQQFGFRSGHSCVHQVQRLTNFIRAGRANKKSVGMLTLDCEQAFPTVWHNGLIHKLMSMDIPLYLCKILLSFMKDRKFSVRVGNAKSSLKTMVAGVPQGSTLSPILYTLYVSDIPSIAHCLIGQYADDTALVTTALHGNVVERRLLDGVRKLQKYFRKWKIQLNERKFEAVFFTRRRLARYHPPNTNITVNNVDVPWSESLKYLGVVIDKGLTFKNHHQNTISKVEKLIKTLYPLINRKSKLSVDTKLLMYKQIFRPVLTYAAPVWRHCARTHKKRLQVSQNKLLKMILNLPQSTETTFVHDTANIDLLDEYINDMSDRFESRTAAIENPEVANLYN